MSTGNRAWVEKRGPDVEPTATMTLREITAAMAARARAWAWRAFSLDLRSLAAFRMAIGGIVAADAMLRSRDMSLMLGPDGLFPLEPLRRYLGDPGAWSLAMLVDASWCGPALLALECAAGLLLAFGCRTRWATLAAWIAVVSVLRRTAPATNAGDAWLACLLFWGMFLPLGATWSWDRRRGGERGSVRSAASAALVLQIAVVYLAAGLSKCNATWLSGDAIRHAMSVHDHGTPIGAWLLGSGWPGRPACWAVVAGELFGPLLLLLAPGVTVRLALVTGFMLFHAATCLTMSLGLFGYVGLAAWLALLPARVWDRHDLEGSDAAATAGRLGGIETAACIAAGVLGLVSLAHDMAPWRAVPLPRRLATLISIPCLHQQWRMFDQVRPQSQWVCGRGELVDGRFVDVLRRGRPLVDGPPEGGFCSLPHHRWHKLFWCLATSPPAAEALGPAVVTALARDWNALHGPDQRLVALDIILARQGAATEGTLQEVVLASWPPRDAVGGGNLDRLLERERTGSTPAGP